MGTRNYCACCGHVAAIAMATALSPVVQGMRTADDGYRPLTADEQEAITDMGAPDHSGVYSGMTWAAWDKPKTIIKLIANRLAEFTDEYDATDGTGYIAYNRRLDYLIEHDES